MSNDRPPTCLAALVALALLVMASSARATAPLLLGYYPSWEKEHPPAAIRMDRFTHLCHSFIVPASDGSLRTEGNMPSGDLVRRAHAAGVKVLVSLGGANSAAAFADMTSTPDSLNRFVDGVMKIVDEHGYDGVDIDWEYPRSAEEGARLVALAREFRGRLGPRGSGRLVTAAAPGSPRSSKWFDASALEPLLDWVAVMTYDIHGPWDKHTGHNAPLHFADGDLEACRAHSASAMMAEWADNKKWPRGRLLFGIPCYGRGFPAPLHKPFAKGADGAPPEYAPYRDVAALAAGGEWEKRRDASAGVPYLSRKSDGAILSYDDPQSAREKSAWAAAQGFGGVFFWEISQDFMDGDHAIVRAAGQGWASAP